MTYHSTSYALSTPRRHALWLVLAALCLAGMLAGPRAAEASCGHYVKRLKASSGDARQAVELAAMPLPWLASGDLPVSPDRGCHGPMCRGIPLAPLPLPAPPPSSTGPQQDLMVVATSSVSIGHFALPLLAAPDSDPREGYPELLDRPPIA